jgi:hypothetical protein
MPQWRRAGTLVPVAASTLAAIIGSWVTGDDDPHDDPQPGGGCVRHRGCRSTGVQAALHRGRDDTRGWRHQRGSGHPPPRGRRHGVVPSGGSSREVRCGLLDDEGVAIVPVPIGGTTREDFAVTAEFTGQQYRFVLPGPTLTAADVDTCVNEMLRRPQWLAPSWDRGAASGRHHACGARTALRRHRRYLGPRPQRGGACRGRTC